MTAEDQSEIVAFLSDPDNWGEGVTDVERVDTHGAMVFLGGDRALKLKRAVKFDYMDFSTPARRKAMCEEELRLNRRTAPGLYRRVVPVTRRADGGLELGGDGEAVDWLVEMTRFDQDTLFDRLARRDALTPALMTALADEIAAFHTAAEPRQDYGGGDDMANVVEIDRAQLERYAGTVFDAADVEALSRRSRAAVRRHRRLIEARRRNGKVRHCHGDLHLRNICLVDGRPTLFDAIEFNEMFAVSDVLYDLAFLIMDLLHRRLDGLANLVFNRYLARTGDIEGLALMPLFLATRAAVRAHVCATMADDRPAAEAAGLRAEARGYLDQALAYLRPAAARLVAIGGLSGSGKSTLAQALAPTIGAAPGALVLRSDVIRKIIAGMAPEERLGPEHYRPTMNRRVYARISEWAAVALAAGHAVIADAVFAHESEREGIEGVAAAAAVPFTGIWLEGDEEILARRLEARRGDASDATVEVLHRQLDYELGRVGWQRLECGARASDLAARAARLVAEG